MKEKEKQMTDYQNNGLQKSEIDRKIELERYND